MRTVIRRITVDGEDLVSQGIVDPNNSYYQKSTTGLTLSGYVNCSLKYKISETEFIKLSDTKLRVRLPEGILVYPGSLRIDGQEYDNYIYRNHWLVVPVSRNEGLVEFCAKPEKYKTFTSIASFNYLKNGMRYDDLLGYLYIDMPKLTLNTSSVIGVKSFNISGTAMPDNVVEVFIDGRKIGQTTANKLGYYVYPVTLIPKESMSYIIESRTRIDEGVELAVTSELQYYPYWPEISQLKMHYWEHSTRRTVDLIAMKENKFVYYFLPSKPLTYSVKLKNNDDVKQVYVCSRQDGVKKRVEAKWDENSQMWITTDYFDDKNHSYIPGVITVEWKPKNTFGRIPEDEKPKPYDPYNTIRNGLNEVVDKVMTDYFESTTLGLADELLELYTGQSVNMGLSQKVPLLKLCNDLISGNIELDTLEGKVDLAVSIISVANILIAGMTGVTLIPAGYLWTGFVGTQLFTIKLYEKIFEQLDLVSGDFSDMQTTGNYDRLSSTLNTLANYVTSFVTGIEMDIIWIKDWIENFKTKDDPKAGNEGDTEHGENGEANVDPRGFVYEAVTSNRLLGVVASVYYRDPVTGVPRYWNAVEYGQKNDQVTNLNGVFAWDVPEGNWQVRCKLAGYENTQSEWLPVPPPQLDVMIPMVSVSVPQVTSANLQNGYINLVFDKYMKSETLKNVEVIDNTGKNITFTLEYSTNETDHSGTVYARDFVLRLPNVLSECTVQFNSQIQSYANVGMWDETMNLKR